MNPHGILLLGRNGAKYTNLKDWELKKKYEKEKKQQKKKTKKGKRKKGGRHWRHKGLAQKCEQEELKSDAQVKHHLRG